ncbi:cytochrome C [Chryseobacterium sp. WG14]|uniref:cytochrome C n=1 Tax=unclassified Chryseobacterium TaxID=2593645 RepID=UPI00211EDD83|nr:MULTISPECIES: cytochrome C [unclassified Chryseobacterium]MCQ9634268.1 cytochrome C [Chryseobacterium sp. WG23]MCQ9638065.1 cytochrome C [Chryseobacterium sp. WG14]
MTKDRSKVFLFIDNDLHPIAELETPIVFDLDTKKLPDGDHVLKIVSRSPSGKEGIRKISFTVANGPTIKIEGLKNKDVVDGTLSLMINAYDKGNQKSFLITGSETPQTIPFWIWVIIILFVGWAVYYEITSSAVQ